MLTMLETVLRSMCSEFTQHDYHFLVEADVCGWLFHLLLLEPSVTANQVHLDTRVRGAMKNAKYDVAIGPVSDDGDRPCVDPVLVIEVKLFPETGFTDQANRVHYEHVLNDDLIKLALLAGAVPDRVELLVDGCEYLRGRYAGQQRLEYLTLARDQVAPGVQILLLRLQNDEWVVERV